MRYLITNALLFLFLISGCGIQKSEADVPLPNANDGSAGKTMNFETFLNRIKSLQTNEQKMALVNRFMEQLYQQGAPLREDTLCYFLFRGNPSLPLSVAGDFNQWKPGVDVFTQITGTDLFYLRKTFPADARLDYKLVSGKIWMLDPLNPNTISGGYGANSQLAMPAYIPATEIVFNPGIPHGRLDSLEFNSLVSGNSRKISVYLPPGYDSEARSYPILYVNDGRDYIKLGKMVNVLDNLLSGNKIYPLVVVFIDPVNRMKEYDFSDTYLQMLAEELIPFIEKKYSGPGIAKKRGIMGPSLGGLISLYAGLKYPGLFGFVAGQSSSLQFHQQAIIALYNESEPVTTKIYLDWGVYESTRDLSVQFVKMLQSRGYRLIHKEYNEGHSWGNWRAHLDNILVAFDGTQSSQFVD